MTLTEQVDEDLKEIKKFLCLTSIELVPTYEEHQALIEERNAFAKSYGDTYAKLEALKEENERLKQENSTLRESDNTGTHHYIRMIEEDKVKDRELAKYKEALEYLKKLFDPNQLTAPWEVLELNKQKAMAVCKVISQALSQERKEDE